MAETGFLPRGGCRCDNNPAWYEYRSQPAGGALLLLEWPRGEDACLEAREVGRRR